jgi:VanZ family protein
MMPKYLIQYKFSILLSGFIVLLSLLPGGSMPHSSLFSIPFFDKFVHFGMYGTLGMVALLEFRCRQICLKKEFLLLSLLFFLSILMEVLQTTVVASRSAEWLDLIANFFGLTAAYAAYAFFRVFRS